MGMEILAVSRVARAICHNELNLYIICFYKMKILSKRRQDRYIRANLHLSPLHQCLCEWGMLRYRCMYQFTHMILVPVLPRVCLDRPKFWTVSYTTIIWRNEENFSDFWVKAIKKLFANNFLLHFDLIRQTFNKICIHIFPLHKNNYNAKCFVSSICMYTLPDWCFPSLFSNILSHEFSKKMKMGYCHHMQVQWCAGNIWNKDSKSR